MIDKVEKCVEEGIRKGLDVSWFVREEWNDEQLHNIHLGLFQAIDVSTYADLKYSSLEMARIRWSLVDERQQLITSP